MEKEKEEGGEEKMRESNRESLKKTLDEIFQKATEGRPHDHAYSDLRIAARDFEKALDDYCDALAEKGK